MELINRGETELIDGLHYRVVTAKYPAVYEEQVTIPEEKDEEGYMIQAEVREQVEITPERIVRIVTDVVDGIEVDLKEANGTFTQNPHCPTPHMLRVQKEFDTGEIDNELQLKLRVRHYLPDGSKLLVDAIREMKLNKDQENMMLSSCQDIDVEIKKTRDSYVDIFGAVITDADAEKQYVQQLIANQERVAAGQEPLPFTVMPEKRWLEQIASGQLIALQVIPAGETRPRMMHYAMIKHMMKVIVERQKLFVLPEITTNNEND